MLSIYTLDQAVQWDTIVCTFSNYDVYWLSGYVKAFKIHGDGEPILFYYEGKGTRGINVVMKRDIAHDKHFNEKINEGELFDFSSPYGYGGWIIIGNDTDQLFIEYEKWCQNNRIVSEFVRFHPIIKNHELSKSFYEVIQLGDIVALDLSTPEIIWANLTSKNRNVIRKAQKNGIKIYNGRCPEIYARFRTIYDSTMVRDNADEYYYFGDKFYESILYELSHNAQVFYAVHEGTIVAASIMLSANGRINYHLSGLLQEHAKLAPTNLLLYEAALWGNANGCKTMHLGGGVGSTQDNLYRFKKAFNRNVDCRFYIGKKVYLHSQYDSLVCMRTDLLENGFFPGYRA